MPVGGRGFRRLREVRDVVGVQMLGGGGAADRDTALLERGPQRLGGELRGVFDADQQVLPAVAQRDGAK